MDGRTPTEGTHHQQLVLGSGNDNRQLCPKKVYIIVIIDAVIVWQALAVASWHGWQSRNTYRHLRIQSQTPGGQDLSLLSAVSRHSYDPVCSIYENMMWMATYLVSSLVGLFVHKGGGYPISSSSPLVFKWTVFGVLESARLVRLR